MKSLNRRLNKKSGDRMKERMNDRMTTKVLKTRPRVGAASPIMLRLQLRDLQYYNSYYKRDNRTASMMMIMEHCQTCHVLIYNNEISMFLRLFQRLKHLCVIIGHLKYTKSYHKYS